MIISNKKIDDIVKIFQALEDSNNLLKGFTKSIKNETNEQKGGLLSIFKLLGTLGASLLRNMLAGKGYVRAGSGIKKMKRDCKSCLWKRMEFSMSPHHLTILEVQKYYQNEPRFKGVYPRNNYP